MTDEEKYFFDLWGFMVVKSALTPEQVATLNAHIDEALVSQNALEKTSHRFGNALQFPIVGQEIIAGPAIMPYLEGLIGPKMRLDHDYIDVILKPGLGPIGATLHGGGTPYDPGQSYQCYNGRIHNGLLVVAYALKDVNEGDGGFACVPGSHKANFPLPIAWRDMTKPNNPVARPIPCQAGDAIIFTEALTHGTYPWSSNNQRRTLFLKYNYPMFAWGEPRYDHAVHPDMPLEARQLLEGPNARYQGRKGAIEE
jgi:hypothetical protein